MISLYIFRYMLASSHDKTAATMVLIQKEYTPSRRGANEPIPKIALLTICRSNDPKVVHLQQDPYEHES
jgi:hypothetical protein